jgi:hypothetical protein
MLLLDCDCSAAEGQAPKEHALDRHCFISPSKDNTVRPQVHFVKPDGKRLITAIFNNEGEKIQLVRGD